MDIVDRLLMSMFAAKGDTQAHEFMQRQSARPNIKPLDIKRQCYGRVFIPPKEEDRVVMFDDNSGVYVHSDGFMTPMGSDISHEIHQWVEEK